MISEVVPYIVILNALLTGSLIVILMKFKRSIPNIQEVLEDVGGSISEQLKEIFTKPAVSKAMGILGKHSGDARANKALQGKVAKNFMGQYPAMNMLLKQLDITPIEGLQLMNDPMIGPLIQKAIGGFIKKGNSPQISNKSEFGSQF